MHLRAFWYWWTTRLRQLVSRPRQNSPIAHLRLDGDFLATELMQNTTVGSIPFQALLQNPEFDRQVGKSRNLNIELGKEHYLLRSKQLPLAVGENAKDILLHDLLVNGGIDAKDDTRFLNAWNFIENDGNSDQGKAQLFAIRRKFIDRLQTELREHGFSIGALLVNTNSGTVNILNQLSHPEFIKRRQWHGRLIATIGLTLLVGGTVTFGHVLYRQSNAIAELESRLEATSREAAEVRKRITTYQAHVKRVQALKAKKFSNPSVRMMLADLTKTLPDDAWVNELYLRPNTIRLVGNAKSAAELIRPVEEVSWVASARFDSNIIKSVRSNTEQFSVSIKPKLVDEWMK